MDLTDKQWDFIENLLPKEQVIPRNGKGRTWRDARDVLNGILWVLRTGAPWNEMPERYPPSSTCHDRHELWVKDGTIADRHGLPIAVGIASGQRHEVRLVNRM